MHYEVKNLSMDYEKVIEKFRELGLFIQDMEQDRAYPNYLWEEWGYTEEEMTRYGFMNFVHPDDREHVENAVRRFSNMESGFSRIIFRIKDKWGTWRWILSSCLAVERDEKGQILQYVGFDHDITQEMEARAQAEKALREAETLISANAAITEKLDFPHTVSAILEQAGRVLSFDSSSVQLLTEKDGSKEMKIVGGSGFSRDSHVIGTSFPITSLTPNARIMDEKKPLVLDRKDLQETYPDFRKNVYEDIAAWMGVPLICKDRLLGMITFDRIEENPYTADDLRLAQAFAGHVAIALENSRLYEETKQLAITDPLTGCYTRRWMFSELEKESETALRRAHDLSLIMLDIDDFKFVNDTYGHLTGDEVLKEITRLIRSILRKYDLFCRAGGEEFIIILPYENVDAAMDIAERIRQLVEKDSQVGKMKNPVTLSLGCTQLRESDRDRIEEFIARADRAMYRSKRKGKNQVSSL